MRPAESRSRDQRRVAHREGGALILEFLTSLGILTVGVLSFFSLFQAQLSADSTLADQDQARIALDNAADLLRRADFREIYAQYHDVALPVPSLKGPDGADAQLEIQCFVDELAIPAEFGPVLDLDGIDGLENTDCSVGYRLLPVRLSLSFLGKENLVRTREIFLMLERGS